MNRRSFLKLLSLAMAEPAMAINTLTPKPRDTSEPSLSVNDDHIKDYLCKMVDFDQDHKDDIFLTPSQHLLLTSSLNRLIRIERTVGHGNFSLISMDQAIKTARTYSSIGPFNADECAFLEMIFHTNGAQYGFLGKKPLSNFTTSLNREKIVKIPGTGNYLYTGKPLENYHSMKKTIGNTMILTSGLRSIPKQFILFLKKTVKSGGNLSRASRSLAPPGYSYHGVGDFDVGQMGYGSDNFTLRFTETQVYKKLRDTGAAQLRYNAKNPLGVRFEPWHIKVL